MSASFSRAPIYVTDLNSIHRPQMQFRIGFLTLCLCVPVNAFSAVQSEQGKSAYSVIPEAPSSVESSSTTKVLSNAGASSTAKASFNSDDSSNGNVFSSSPQSQSVKRPEKLVRATIDPGKGQLTIAQAGKRTQLKPAPIPPNPAASPGTLTVTAREIADLAGITPVLTELIDAQRSQLNTDQPSLASIAHRQKLIYLREKLNALVQAANLQINSTRGKIDAATAQADELRAYITERRNRLTHKTSQVNLLSGGVTKIVGYSIALADLPSIPTNVLEVFDGTVQTSLTGFALRQEKQEAKLEHGMPQILGAFLDERRYDNQFPNSVWQFLNNSAPGSVQAVSRRQALIKTWQTTGVLVRARVDGQVKPKRNVTIELLDQRLAMLSDVRSVVSEMHYGLMEVSDAIMQSFANDPVF